MKTPIMSMAQNAFEKPATALAFCVAVSAALIAGAHAFERIGGMAPCLLCLDQREAHWAAIAAGGIALVVVTLGKKSTRVVAASLGALAILYGFSSALAGYHAGVEWGFWPGPDTCSASGEDLAAGSDLLASLDKPAAGPSCSDAAWRMAGISMAGYNALISLGLCAFALFSCRRAAQTLKEDRVGGGLTAEI